MEIVKITWIDAQRLEIGCQDVNEMKNIQPIECDIVGFKVDEDDKRIVIAQEKWEETNQIKYVHVIPKCSIIKITKLGEVK